MKNFITGKGNTVVGIIFTIILFVLLRSIFGLYGIIPAAIGGAISGAVGFGLAGLLKSRLEKGEEKADEEETGE